MDNVYLFAGAEFLSGVALLGGWVWLTARRSHRSGALFKKSLWLFVLPILFAPWSLFNSAAIPVLIVLFEEGLKVIGAYSEKEATDRFWLITLYGIWEITVDKPLQALLFWESEIAAWQISQVIVLIAGTFLPVLMHCATAAIYAIQPKDRLWAAYIISSIVHFAFNVAV